MGKLNDPLKFWDKNQFITSSYFDGLKHNRNTQKIVDGCRYTYNELGFRADSISKEGFKIMTIGCSNTEGVGVDDKDTWPSLLCSTIPNSVNINLGHGGRSNDYICRTLLTFYEYFNPDIVIILYTNLHRREVYTKNNEIEGFIPTHANLYFRETTEGEKIQNYLFELQNDNDDFINWYKNHLLIKYFLESKKCNWIWDGNDQVRKYYTDEFMLDKNYCNLTQETYNKLIDNGTDGIHPGPNHNLIYANYIREIISNKFQF